MKNMGFVRVGSVSALPVDTVTEITVGENCFALCNVEGTIRAVSGICLHQGGPLAQGNLADGRLVCPWHAWEWDVRTGENCGDPSERLATYEVKIEGDDILLQVP